jgi:hypothetical protein
MTTLINEKIDKKNCINDLKKEREKDHKMVKGIFRCYEPLGGSFTFCFKKYKRDQTLKYTMIDGETYNVPFMIAKHLNSNCWYPVHSHILDENGKPSIGLGKKIKRCSFESMEFYDEDK